MEGEFPTLFDCISVTVKMTGATILYRTDMEDMLMWMPMFKRHKLTAQFGVNGLDPLLEFLRQLVGAFARQVDLETSVVFINLVNCTFDWVKDVHQLVTAFMDAEARAVSGKGKGKAKRYSSFSFACSILTLMP
jgi:hypothetical protein